jgi:biotin transport system substrate-specific component
MTARWLALPVFALLMAVCARVTVPMTPVSMTLQTFAVLLAGAVLGPWRGAASVLLYLAMGAVGLPVFSDGAAGLAVLSGPTAGYLLAFPLAAGMVGALAGRPAFRPHWAATMLMLAGHLLILAFGAAWLAAVIGGREALAAGVTPFLIGAAVKSVAVVAVAAGLRRLARARRV